MATIIKTTTATPPTLPILDFSHFHSDSETERSELIETLTSNLEQNGAVRLINHGVSDEVISELFDWVGYYLPLFYSSTFVRTWLLDLIWLI